MRLPSAWRSLLRPVALAVLIVVGLAYARIATTVEPERVLEVDQPTEAVHALDVEPVRSANASKAEPVPNHRCWQTEDLLFN